MKNNCPKPPPAPVALWGGGAIAITTYNERGRGSKATVVVSLHVPRGPMHGCRWIWTPFVPQLSFLLRALQLKRATGQRSLSFLCAESKKKKHEENKKDEVVVELPRLEEMEWQVR